jgi:hypothetical protein
MDIREIEKHDTVNLIIKQDSGQEEGISLGDILAVLKSGKRLIAVFTAVALVLSLMAAGFYAYFLTPSDGSVRALISFNYDGIDKGLDPHGKVFDIDKLRAPVVLDKVMNNLGLYDRKLTTEDLRRNISEHGIVPNDIIDKILLINKMAEKDVTKLAELENIEYHPTQYMITFNVDKKLGINSSDAKKVLNDVLNEYRNYFYDTYGDKDVLSSAVGEVKYEEYDYPEVARVMRGQMDIIKSYLGDKNSKSPDFRAKSTQMSFGDIITYLNIVEDVDVSRMSSLIFSYNLTKDKDRLLSLYEYRIEQFNVDMAKQQDESKMAQAAVDKYQKDKNIVLMPGLTTSDTQSSTLEFDQKNQYYDQLTQRALDKGVSASDYSHDIDYYKKVIDKLNNDSVTEILKQKYMSEVDSLILNVSDKLKQWVDIVNKTVDEYYQTEVFRDAVKVPVPAEYSSPLSDNLKKLILIIIGVTFAGVFIGILFVFLKSAVAGGIKKPSDSLNKSI